MATRRPSRLPRCRHIVKASSSACVGCSWVPSPAFTTLLRDQPALASRCGAPEAQWRTTTASAPIASRVSEVSFRLSPLLRLEPLAEKLMTSAESRLAAASNEILVRVLSSKKRFTTVRPRSAGSFLIGRSASERISSAVRSTSSASERLRSAALSRCFFTVTPRELAVLAPGLVRGGRCDRRALSLRSRGGPLDDHRVLVVDAGQVDPHPLHQRGGEVLADEVGPDRQLAVPAVDQDRELDPAGPAD